MIGAMEEQVCGTWYATARSVGVLERDYEIIAGAFTRPKTAITRDTKSLDWAMS